MTELNSKNEFLIFMNSNKNSNIALEEKTLAKIALHNDPPIVKIFIKILTIHILAVIVTLIFCPQFGLSIGPYSLAMNTMMQFGMNACMFGCGFIFLGASAFSYTLTLSVFERQKLQGSFFLLPLLLSTLSYGAFLILHSTGFNEYVLFWFIGSVIGGMAVSCALDSAKRFMLRRRLCA